MNNILLVVTRLVSEDVESGEPKTLVDQTEFSVGTKKDTLRCIIIYRFRTN